MVWLTLALMLVMPDVQGWMQHAFYPVLLFVLVAASLGVPIPEDVPLLAAGVILSHQPEAVTWAGTLAVALIGIMSGDIILYAMGSIWGQDVCRHRWVNGLITPARLERMTAKFHRYGMLMCFFGRFFVGVRAAMCITAGVTRLRYWKFMLADLAGALLSVPLFIWLGYWFAGMLPTVKAYVHFIQWILLGLALAALAGFVIYRRVRPTNIEVATNVATIAPTPEQQAPSVGSVPATAAAREAPKPVEEETCV